MAFALAVDKLAVTFVLAVDESTVTFVLTTDKLVNAAFDSIDTFAKPDSVTASCVLFITPNMPIEHFSHNVLADTYISPTSQ
jgi:hypothetical protein